MRVDDEGPGVPPEAREAIFRRFHSVRPEGEAFGKHSGLGLAIAKATVEAHDGWIAAEDRADATSGARFTLTLPAVALCANQQSMRLPLPWMGARSCCWAPQAAASPTLHYDCSTG